MSTYIQLTALTRNGQPFAKNILVDVNNIVSPVIVNDAGNAVLELDEDPSYSIEYQNSKRFPKYEVDEDLADINALTSEVFLGDIIEFKGKPNGYLAPQAVFVKSRIVGVVEDLGGDSKFSYRQLTNQSPDEFIVDQDLATINT